MLVTPFMSAGHESEDVAAFAVAESSASLCHGGLPGDLQGSPLSTGRAASARLRAELSEIIATAICFRLQFVQVP